MVKLGLNQIQILVIGDAMLDVYISGKVSRISPEAPVPVVDILNTSYHAGGAANVAANIASLGVNASLCAPIGNGKGDKLGYRRLLSDLNIKLWEIDEGSHSDWLSQKTRIVGNDYQIVRLDEDKFFDWKDFEEDFLAVLHDDLVTGKNACVVLSDYGKGVLSDHICQNIIEECSALKIPVFVDPKDGDWEKYRGAFCIKPNLYELSKRFGCASFRSISNVRWAAERLINDLSVASVVVTMGERGMLLVQKEEPRFMHFEALPVGVADVSGAGDTAMAVLVTYHSAGLPLSAAVHYANKAAAVVVSRKGTQIIRLSDIEEST